MKVLKYSLLGLLLLVVVAAVGTFFYIEPLVKTTVNTVGTKIVGTKVNLDGFRFSPFVGEAEVTGLSVANPEGYKTANLINLGRVFIKVDVKSLFTDTIVVEEVSVNDIALAYEMPDLSTSNVMQIQQNIAKNTASKETPVETTEKVIEKEVSTAEKTSKNIIIKKVVVDGGSLTAMIPLQPEALTLNMPAIEIEGIGEQGKKMSIQESVATLFNKILFNATSVVTKSLTEAKNIVNEAANKAIDEAKGKVSDEVNGLLDKVKFW